MQLSSLSATRYKRLSDRLGEKYGKLDSTCNQFENLLARGSKPDLSDYVGNDSSPDDELLFRELLELHVFYSRRSGETPDPEQYLSRWPSRGHIIREVLAVDLDRDMADTLNSARIRRDEPPSLDLTGEFPIYFGRYTLLGVLGAGGMGTVFLAEDQALGRKVALKIPHFRHAKRSESQLRFRREARMSARLSHPNICKIHDIGEHQGQLFLTMAYIEGQPLADVMRQGKRQEARTAAKAMHKIATAVACAHENGIVHRDLKPANIMVTKDYDFVVMDFGLARQFDSLDPLATANGVILGTPAYMSPEQLRSDQSKVGPSSDVYSLGIILVEMLTGKRCYQGTLPEICAKILSTQDLSPSSFGLCTPPNLDAICVRATRSDPSLRFKTAGEFASALAEYIQTAKSVGNKDSASINQPQPKETVRLNLSRETDTGGHASPSSNRSTVNSISTTAGLNRNFASAKRRNRIRPSHLVFVLILTIVAGYSPGAWATQEATAKWIVKKGGRVSIAGRDDWIKGASFPADTAFCVDKVFFWHDERRGNHEPIAWNDVHYLRNFEMLEFLELRAHPIGDRACALLAQMPKLRVLNLHACGITDYGLQQLEPLTNLEELDIGYSQGKITDLGALSLLKMPKLTRLNLVGASIHDDTLRDVFAKLPQLRYVEFSVDKVTNEAIESLERSNPSLVVSTHN